MASFMRTASAMAALATAMLAAQPAHAIFGDDEARKAIIDLRGRVELQQRDTNARLDDIDRRLAETTLLIETRTKLLAERLDRIEQIARGQLELQSQIDAMRQDLARLRGTLEVQTNELALTQRRQREMAAEIDARIKPFEPVQVQIDGKAVNVEPEEKRTFEGSLALFRAGDFAAAVTGFQQLRLRWPESAYTPGALFWSGSAQFALKDYKAAMATHQSLLKRFPDHARAPDAMLNVGLAQLESGDKRAARSTLETVVEKYADSPAGQTAKQRLATIR